MTQTILDLCKGSEKNQGERVGMQWWEKAGIDLAGAREMAEATERADNNRLEE